MLAVLALALSVVPASPIPLPALPGQHVPVVVEQEARDLEVDVNADRERQNLPALHSDERLHAIALEWALHMANQHFFGHFDFEGRGLVDRLHDAAYVVHFAAENLSLEGDAHSANTALMSSEGHRANILSTSAKRIGVAAVNIAPRETLFVEDFSD
jgi:uncharacterized protein YkwD